MTLILRTDFSTLSDGDVITLYPKPDNPLHKEPVKVMYQGGYFYTTKPCGEGRDYDMRDVLKFNDGFTTDA